MTIEDFSTGPSSLGLATRKLTGRIKIHPAGYGFVVPDDKSEDVHVSGPQPRRRHGRRHGRGRNLAGLQGRRGPRAARARARPRQDHRPARAARRKQPYLQPDDPRITGPVALRGRVPRAASGRRWSPRSPATRRARTARSRRRCSRCWAIPTTRAPRSRRCWPCADVEEQFPDEVARAAPTACRRRCATPTASIASTCATSRSRPSIRRPRATSTTRSCIETRPHGGTRLWVAVADVSHYVREGDADRREARHRGVRSTCPTARSRCCPSRCRRASARWCRRWIGWRWWCASTSIGDARRSSTPTSARRSSTRARGSTIRASRRRWGATCAASGSKYEPFLPGAARDGRAGAPDARRAARARRARLRHPRAVGRARRRRSAAGARRPQVAARSGRAAGATR